MQSNLRDRLVLTFDPTHYHLQVEPNPKKNCTIKPMLFSVFMGKTGLTHDIFFEFSLRPFEVVEVEWKSASKEPGGLFKNHKEVYR